MVLERVVLDQAVLGRAFDASSVLVGHSDVNQAVHVDPEGQGDQVDGLVQVGSYHRGHQEAEVRIPEVGHCHGLGDQKACAPQNQDLEGQKDVVHQVQGVWDLKGDVRLDPCQVDGWCSGGEEVAVEGAYQEASGTVDLPRFQDAN